MSADHIDNVVGASTMLKAAPPVVTSGLLLFGIPISQWAIIITIIYTLLLIGGFVYDRFIKKAPPRRMTDAEWEEFWQHRNNK